MPSVVFWAAVGGGTEQYRCLTPGAALERVGWEVRHVEDDGSDLCADVVVLQRLVHPSTPDAIRALQANGSRVVYDIDDWYDGLPTYNPASTQITDSELKTLHDSLRAADLITCSTPELAEGYAAYGPTRVLPNLLDPDIWGDASRYRKPRFATHLGWMGNASYRSADLALLRPWLADFVHGHPQLRFVVAGSDHEVFETLGVGGLICPPSINYVRPYEHLPAMLAWFDIGLVPLATNRFNDAKSWCKGLEYGACGVPVVASPRREYRSFVQPGRNGALVRRGDWPTAVRYVLAHLPELQRGARQVAEEHFIDRHIDLWADAYLSALVPA